MEYVSKKIVVFYSSVGFKLDGYTGLLKVNQCLGKSMNEE